MPTQIVFTDADFKRSGIEITYKKTRQLLEVSGWYDSFVGIEGNTLTLHQFFTLLGITLKDCTRAFKEKKNEAQRLNQSRGAIRGHTT